MLPPGRALVFPSRHTSSRAHAVETGGGAPLAHRHCQLSEPPPQLEASRCLQALPQPHPHPRRSTDTSRPTGSRALSPGSGLLPPEVLLNGSVASGASLIKLQPWPKCPTQC